MTYWYVYMFTLTLTLECTLMFASATAFPLLLLMLGFIICITARSTSRCKRQQKPPRQRLMSRALMASLQNPPWRDTVESHNYLGGFEREFADQPETIYKYKMHVTVLEYDHESKPETNPNPKRTPNPKRLDN